MEAPTIRFRTLPLGSHLARRALVVEVLGRGQRDERRQKHPHLEREGSARFVGFVFFFSTIHEHCTN